LTRAKRLSSADNVTKESSSDSDEEMEDSEKSEKKEKKDKKSKKKDSSSEDDEKMKEKESSSEAKSDKESGQEDSDSSDDDSSEEVIEKPIEWSLDYLIEISKDRPQMAQLSYYTISQILLSLNENEFNQLLENYSSLLFPSSVSLFSSAQLFLGILLETKTSVNYYFFFLKNIRFFLILFIIFVD